MYALAPEFDCVALVMQNVSFPSSIAARISFTETSPEVKPSSSATDCFIPKITGEVLIDSSCFTICISSPRDIHRLLAVHTAS